MTARARLYVLVAAAQVMACDCVGLITTPLPTLVPVGTGEIDDTVRCAHRALAGAPTSTWTRAGPPGASVHALLPLGQGVLLVGTGLARSTGVLASHGAGVYRSTDHGRTVTKVLTVASGSVESLVKAGSSVLAGVSSDEGTGGVWESADQGLTFTAASTGLHTGARVIGLTVAAGSPDRVYALVRGSMTTPNGAETTLYRRDGTAAWQLLSPTGLDPTAGGPLGAIAADPGNRDTLFAVDGNALYRSTDAGQTFSELAMAFYGPPSGLGNPSALVLVPGTPLRLLVVTTDTGVLETTDLGATFTELLPDAVNEYPPVAAAVPTSDGLLIGTQGSGVVRSGSATTVGDCLLDRVVISMAVAPDEGAVWVGTNGGLYLSTDGAKRFETVGEGLTEVLGRFTVAEIDGVQTVFLMSSAGLYRYTSAAAAWERQGDWAQTVGFSDLSVAPGGELGFASVDEELFPGHYGVTGSVWQWKLKEHKVLKLGGIDANVGAVRADPLTAGRVFAYQRGGTSTGAPMTGVLTCTAGSVGATFTPSMLTSTALTTSTTFRFAPLAVATDGTLYAGSRLADGTPVLLRSDDGGATKTEVWRGQGWVTYGVYVDPAGAVLLTGSQGNVAVRRSTDRGQTFAPFDDGLMGFAKLAYALGFAPGGGLLVGTEDGVHFAADGTHFSALNVGLERVPVWSVAVLPASPNPIVLAGTAQGLYWRTLP